jgi:hypothetical protein
MCRSRQRSHLNGSFFIKLNQAQCYLISTASAQPDVRFEHGFTWHGAIRHDRLDKHPVPVLHFILLTAVAHDDLKPAMQSAKNSKTSLQKDKNGTKFITYNTYIGQPISNKMVEEA